jgi:hypothetical protein
MIPVLSKACNAVGFVVCVSNIVTINTVFVPFFYSIMKYAVLEGGRGEECI